MRIPGLLPALLFLILSQSLLAQTEEGAVIDVQLSVRGGYVVEPVLRQICNITGLGNLQQQLGEEGLRLGIPVPVADRSHCQLVVEPPAGYSTRYEAEGDSRHRADARGCWFSEMNAGHLNLCRIELIQEPVTITVYKHWIGASGDEEDIRVSLDCESGRYDGDRFINTGKPGRWDISDIDPEGVLCNVSEEVRESFRPDIIDCQGLLIQPGRGEECTMVNTRIVKHIEALNRYGKVVMILLVLGVGLMAVRRYSS